ncbi:MAG: bifunctional oligoribonuclease/PAP phosphatase NrnA [Bacteroidales bacterium]|jgi:phosphoesterase RecJ-like protein|nr:bifunctional oligoribonuclease/PAP phosphatase NrnA [Bacteroidales bacterium]MDD3273446.1 bifunctional oligoribonuclease/PAP phosphatase NrnA [Bacteroidales bacterium]MDD4058246.1 bifunctional oligoribonuclease/PAP phosphatase NrnA [Bacteroidales bacterium]
MKGYLKRNSADNFKKVVNSATSVVILTHTNPDGDALGSVIALKSYLSTLGVRSRIVVPNPYPKNLKFLDSDGDVIIYSWKKESAERVIKSADLIIALDFNQLKRIDDLEPLVRNSSAKKILIDHHPLPEKEAFDLVISNTEVSSTCELLFWLIREMEDGSINRIPDISAQSLYVGMMTDTNNFSNSVEAGTFLMSYELLLHGVDKETLQLKVFAGFTEERMRLMGHSLLNKMKILPELGAGYIILTKSELDEFKFLEGDSEGFVNMPLNIYGITISALFTEKDEHIRVSLRSSDDFSVNQFSRKYFNGAGHERAAGGRLYIPVEEVGEYFEESLRKELEAN